MKKVIDDFNTVLLISKAIGYRKTVLLLQNLINKQRGDITSNDVKEVYDKEYFEVISKQEEKRRINGIVINTYIDTVISFFEELNKKNIKILDFGCGSGNFALALASLGFNVDGFDYFEPEIEKANKKALELSINKNCHFYSNIKDLNKNKYDYIVFSDVVEHISKEELGNILSELKGHISKSGNLIFHTPNGLFHESCPKRIRIFDLYFLLKNLYIFNFKNEDYKISRLKSAYYDQVHINIMTPNELKEILEEKYFSNFQIQYFDKNKDTFVQKLKSTGSFWLTCEKSK